MAVAWGHRALRNRRNRILRAGERYQERWEHARAHLQEIAVPPPCLGRKVSTQIPGSQTADLPDTHADGFDPRRQRSMTCMDVSEC